VALLQGGREVASAMTDTSGTFQISGLRGGNYTLASAGSTTNIRIWSEGSAPPSARPAVVLVEPGVVVRGNNGGGAFWRTVTNPWVSATAIAAAIAVPIALNNNDSGS
jgi:predicted DCC family thiol-disulfide oxidoreductase YuxK